MNDKSNHLRFCGECDNKIKDSNLPNGAFICPLIVDVISNGIVFSDTDASACVKHNRFKCHL